jgi:FKBP-type peptidyl-prolyl cis-trans isomerase 2
MKKFTLSALAVCTLVLLTACSSKPTDNTTADETDAVVKNGDTVSVNYILTLEDGTVKDTSYEDIAKANNIYIAERPYEPLTFAIGQQQMIPGFEQGVVGMTVGEKKKITLQPDQAYGNPDEKLVQVISGSIFEQAGIEAKVWETFNFQFAPGTVKAIDEVTGDITIDLNHPLAGQTLTFDIELVSIEDANVMWSGAMIDDTMN